VKTASLWVLVGIAALLLDEMTGSAPRHRLPPGGCPWGRRHGMAPQARESGLLAGMGAGRMGTVQARAIRPASAAPKGRARRHRPAPRAAVQRGPGRISFAPLVLPRRYSLTRRRKPSVTRRTNSGSRVRQ